MGGADKRRHIGEKDMLTQRTQRASQVLVMCGLTFFLAVPSWAQEPADQAAHDRDERWL